MIKLFGWLFAAGKLGKLLGYAVGFVLLLFVHELGHYAVEIHDMLKASGAG